MKWIIKEFHDLSVEEFHDILRLRIDVFVVEQDCPYHELDNKDKIAFHLMGINNDHLISAYTRIFKPGDYYKEAAFGRVVVHKDFRRQKLGDELVKETLDATYKLMGKIPIKIDAQTYLKKFYTSFGFKQVGEAYIEDGIPHIHMLKK